MGDGEIMGAAIEGAMNVELVVDLIKNTRTPVPRIENDSQVMFVGSGRPLEDAARVAFKAMVGWVRSASGMSELDAYQFVHAGRQSAYHPARGPGVHGPGTCGEGPPPLASAMPSRIPCLLAILAFGAAPLPRRSATSAT
jgi:hypothetical protein